MLVGLVRRRCPASGLPGGSRARPVFVGRHEFLEVTPGAPGQLFQENTLLIGQFATGTASCRLSHQATIGEINHAPSKGPATQSRGCTVTARTTAAAVAMTGGNADHRPNLCNLGIPLLLVKRILHCVDDPNGLSLHRGSSNHRPRTGRNRCRHLNFHIAWVDAISGRKTIQALVQLEYDGCIGATESRRGIDHALQNWLQIEF